jgi:P-type E1-E2 ATPase
LGCWLARIEAGREAGQKRVLVERLGAERVVAIGNGANDAQMLSAAALGIAILGREGLAVEALQAADLVVGGPEDTFDLLLHPWRLIATLRR